MFPDSAIAKKMACGRTEALLSNVLASKSVELIVCDLTSDSPVNPSLRSYQ